MALAALPSQAFLRHVCTSLSAPSPQAHEAGTMIAPFNRCGNSSSEQAGPRSHCKKASRPGPRSHGKEASRPGPRSHSKKRAGCGESSWGSSNPALHPQGAVSWTEMGAKLAQSPSPGHRRLSGHDGDYAPSAFSPFVLGLSPANKSFHIPPSRVCHPVLLQEHPGPREIRQPSSRDGQHATGHRRKDTQQWRACP